MFDFLDEFGLWIAIGLSVVIGLLLVPYILVPIMVFFGLKLSGEPELEEFYLEDPDLPRAVYKYVRRTLDDIEEDGFAVLGAYYLKSLVANVRSFLVLVCNEKEHDYALLAVTSTKTNDGIQIQQRHIEYSTGYKSGGSIDTNNSEEISAFAPVDTHPIHSLPWIRDPRHLYRIHRAILQRDRPDDQKKHDIGDNPAKFLRKALVASMSRQIPTGYLYQDGEGDFRPTLKGAILMAYKNLWPFKSMLISQRKRKGEALLKELQLSDKPISSKDQHA